MTLEEAKSLMLKKGASKAMADSKTLAFALDVFGDTDLYTESWEAQRKLKELVDDIYKKESVLQELEKIKKIEVNKRRSLGEVQLGKRIL